MYFNSIKVQLKPRHHGKSIDMKDYFNSIKVQLKLAPLLLVHYQNAHFNSIKVQLKRRKCASVAILHAISIP